MKAYTVELTELAEESYRKIYNEARPHLERGENSHPGVKKLRIVDECIDTLIPHDPFHPDRALAGSLSNVYRVKKGRMRICYVGSSKEATLVILYISETPRKQGDKQDPYALFTKLVMSGQYDKIFSQLGIKSPNRKALSRFTLLSFPPAA